MKSLLRFSFIFGVFLISPVFAEPSLTSKKSAPVQEKSLSSQAPTDSWEAWLSAIVNGGKNGLPGRPDAKPIEAQLPVWVDCYLSHYLDQPSSPKNSLISKLILRSNSKICAGSLTEWAE